MFPLDGFENLDSLAMITPYKGIISFVEPTHPEERISGESLPLPTEEIIHNRSLARNPFLITKQIVNCLIGDIEENRRVAKIWRPFIECMNRIYLDVDDNADYHNSWFADFLSDEILQLIVNSTKSESTPHSSVSSQLQEIYKKFEYKIIKSGKLSSEFRGKTPLILSIGVADENHALPLSDLENSPIEGICGVSDLPKDIQQLIVHQLVEIHLPNEHHMYSNPLDPPEKHWSEMVSIFDKWNDKLANDKSPFENTTSQILFRNWAMSQRDIVWALGSLVRSYPTPEARLVPCLPSISFMLDPFITNIWNFVTPPSFTDSIFPWVRVPLVDDELERLSKSYMIELNGTTETQFQVNQKIWNDFECQIYTDEVWEVYSAPKYDEAFSAWGFEVNIDDAEIEPVDKFANQKATQIKAVLKQIEKFWNSDHDDLTCPHCDRLKKALGEHEGHGTDLPVRELLSDNVISGLASDTIEKAATLYPTWVSREITETQHSLIESNPD